MSSSSDSEPDENTKMLMASVDTSFLSEKFYNKPTGDTEENKEDQKPDLPKSNRYLQDNEEVIWKSDVKITDSMKSYCSKKFTEMVSNLIEFVEVEPESKTKKSKKRKSIDETDENEGVRLFAGAPFIDLSKDSLPDLPEMVNKPLNVKRRIVEDDTVTEQIKIKEASIDPDRILAKSDTKHWKSRQKPKLYEYKTKKGVSYLREPVTEWTEARNKNNWSESKIKEYGKRVNNGKTSDKS